MGYDWTIEKVLNEKKYCNNFANEISLYDPEKKIPD